ncbi:MAG: sodium-dependent transporter [Muribaculaceae bacterium]|nr:sodium-dependent transporter [Muribaculaceae bacterium]
MKKSNKNLTFSSKIGLIAATVGSAVGLGNIWRFPAVAQANGGGAFLIIYIGCVILLGIPVMLAEFSIGRAGKSDAIGSMKSLGAGKGWRSFGGLSIMAAYLILSFYMVVVGWTVEYLWESITGELYANVGPDMKSTFAGHMKEYISDTWTPMVATVIMIVINIGVLLGGVQKGIERLSNWLMPVLFVLLVVFCIRALSFEKALEGYTFFLRPDWSVVTSGTFISALGQAFFSLSLGMGVLVTYSSYFPGDTNLTKTAVTVSLLDLLVAVMMGLIIFPAVMSFGLNGEGIEGATLVFVTLPEVFMQMHGTQIWSILFFLLLAVAALTSTISVAEVAVACIRDRFKVSRLKAVLIVMLPLFVISPICSLSQGALSGVTIFGLSIFNFLDTLATNVLLPVVSIGLCIWLGWFAPKGLLSDQLSNAGSLKTRLALPIRFIIRWIAPLLILTVFICGFL